MITASRTRKGYVWVDWDNGSTLALLEGVDTYRILKRVESGEE